MSLPAGTVGPVDVEVLDAAGRIVLRRIVSIDLPTIDLSEVEAGNYLVRVFWSTGGHHPSCSAAMNRLLPSVCSLAFGAVLAVISAAEAQTWEVFDTTSAGFPSNSVVDIAIDRQNIVWVATDWACAGMTERTDNFNTDNSGLPENTIQCIAVDTLDRLWVGTLFHGVVVYDGMTWTAFDQTNSGLPDDQIRSITIDHRNWAWVGTYLGAACYTGSEWRLYNDQPTSYNGLVMNGSVINDVAVREDGLVAIATLNGGFHYLTDTCIHYHSTFTDFFPDNTQTAVAFDPNLDQR